MRLCIFLGLVGFMIHAHSSMSLKSQFILILVKFESTNEQVIS